MRRVRVYLEAGNTRRQHQPVVVSMNHHQHTDGPDHQLNQQMFLVNFVIIAKKTSRNTGGKNFKMIKALLRNRSNFLASSDLALGVDVEMVFRLVGKKILRHKRALNTGNFRLNLLKFQDKYFVNGFYNICYR